MTTEKSMMVIIKNKAKLTNHNQQIHNHQAAMGRPGSSKNVMSRHMAGGDRHSIKCKGERMENMSRKEQKACEDWIIRMASSRQGTGI
jgi:hypothetical protein